jgi:low affinity Fe/Cu permease
MTFAAAAGVILFWAVTGPIFGFSDTWQLVVNTGTTIVTFLMVFLIQNTQNRDTAAIQLKLDEIIRSTKGAQNALLDVEALGDEHIQRLLALYHELAQRARENLPRSFVATGTPEVTDGQGQLPER